MNKRKHFSVEEKAHIIFRLENNEKNSNIANEFGVSHSTISTIWKSRDKIKREFECERYNVKKIRGSDRSRYVYNKILIQVPEIIKYLAIKR